MILRNPLSTAALACITAGSALLSGCVMRYDHAGGYASPVVRQTLIADNYPVEEPYYYYGGTQYFIIDGGFVYYSGGRRYFVQRLPYGGTLNHRHPLFPNHPQPGYSRPVPSPSYVHPSADWQRRSSGTHWYSSPTPPQRPPASSTPSPSAPPQQPSRQGWTGSPAQRPGLPTSRPPSPPAPSASPSQAPSQATAPAAAQSAPSSRTPKQSEAKDPAQKRSKKAPGEDQN